MPKHVEVVDIIIRVGYPAHQTVDTDETDRRVPKTAREYRPWVANLETHNSGTVTGLEPKLR